ncbi:MAG: hypothetical protein K2H83_00745 [Duncaniella sp.]|nr:hypothetical protein [Duncaniella sp.]MDE5733652.1 hypothetical protein [Duncaniella sp.]MDE6177924.1 hypothetical protein [Duncaniella sp.]
MDIPGMHELLMWAAVVVLIVTASYTGMRINRYLTYKSHREAIAELRRRVSEDSRRRRHAGTAGVSDK